MNDPVYTLRQLVMYFFKLGTTLAGIAFVVLSLLMVLGIGYAYVKAGGLPWMQAVFYDIGAAVIGIIAVSSYKSLADWHSERKQNNLLDNLPPGKAARFSLISSPY